MVNDGRVEEKDFGKEGGEDELSLGRHILRAMVHVLRLSAVGPVVE